MYLFRLMQLALASYSDQWHGDGRSVYTLFHNTHLLHKLNTFGQYMRFGRSLECDALSCRCGCKKWSFVSGEREVHDSVRKPIRCTAIRR